MAKRKRLSPAQPGSQPAPASAPMARPPIAQVAGEAAAVSALGALQDEWDAAREQGRLIVTLPLERVDETYLVRDRAALEPEALIELKQSLKSRGQQTPIEVVRLDAARFGLISGWRRLSALKDLYEETQDDRFAKVDALIRQPDELADSYVAMVEENEIRLGLSFYERARIVRKALDEGVFESDKQALQSLFSNVSYAKRSKIKSFLPVVSALDGALRFPAQMTERTGLALAKALEADPSLAGGLRAALAKANPKAAEAETACLLGALKPTKKEPKPQVRDIQITDGLTLVEASGKLVIKGEKATPDLARRLRIWLEGEV